MFFFWLRNFDNVSVLVLINLKKNIIFENWKSLVGLIGLIIFSEIDD